MSALSVQTYTDFDVLIVDNASSDGSQELIRQLEEGVLPAECAGTALRREGSETSGCSAARLPFSVRGIFLPENTGFSGAVNAGILETQSPYVILLNNDTEPEPDYVRELVGVLLRDKRERVFAVSPKMLQLHAPKLLDDAGDGYCLLGWAFQRGVGQKASAPRFNSEISVFSACAGAAVYRRAQLLQLALSPGEYFDEQHFAYLEDIDLCYRARLLGLTVRYCPKAVVRHVGSGTSGSRYNAFKVKLAARNNVYLNYKNMPFLQLVLNLPGILLGVFIKLLFFRKIGFGRAYAEGFLEGIRTMGACRKQAFSLLRLPRYIGIELYLFKDTFSYAADFLQRRCAKCTKKRREER